MTAREVRFWSKVSFPAGGRGCWLWTGGRFPGGYGSFNVQIRNVGAHRFAYSICVGEVPAGMELDHVRARGCVHRHCVNPSHLEPVTPAENVRRGMAGKVNNFALSKTHCPRGHEYAGANLYLAPSGGRRCRACAKQTFGAWYQKSKQLAKLLAALP